MRPERFFLTVLPDFTPLSNIAPNTKTVATFNMTCGRPATSFAEHKDWKFPKVAFEAVWANWRNNG